MENYIDSVDVDIDTRCTISQYLKFIQDRASGNFFLEFNVDFFQTSSFLQYFPVLLIHGFLLINWLLRHIATKDFVS